MWHEGMPVNGVAFLPSRRVPASGGGSVMIAALFFSIWFAALGVWAGWCARAARFELAQTQQWFGMPGALRWRIVFAEHLLAPVCMMLLWLLLFFAFPWESRCVPYP